MRKGVWFGVGIMGGYWAASNLYQSKRNVRRGHNGELRNGRRFQRHGDGPAQNLLSGSSERGHRSAGGEDKSGVESVVGLRGFVATTIAISALARLTFTTLWSDADIAATALIPAALGDVYSVGNEVFAAVNQELTGETNIVAALGYDVSNLDNDWSEIQLATGEAWQIMSGNIYNLIVSVLEHNWVWWIQGMQGWALATFQAIYPYLADWWDYGIGVYLDPIALMWGGLALEGTTPDQWFNNEITNWWSGQTSSSPDVSGWSLAEMAEQLANILAYLAGDVATAVTAVLNVLPWLTWLAEHSIEELIALFDQLPGVTLGWGSVEWNRHCLKSRHH